MDSFNKNQMKQIKRMVEQAPDLKRKADAPPGANSKKAKPEEGGNLPPGFKVQQTNGTSDPNKWVDHSADWKYLPSKSTFHRISTDTYFLYNEKTGEYTPTTKPVLAQEKMFLELSSENSVMQGRREKQEDRNVQIKDLHKAAKALKSPVDHLPKPAAMYSVYDGHQGSLCSEHCAKAMTVRIIKKLSTLKDITDENIKQLFIDAFNEVDKEFLAKYRTARDGSTAVIVLIIGDKLYCASCGDSEALVGMRQKDGSTKCIPMSVLHKPKDDKDRIEKAGGVVMHKGGCWRVMTKDFDEVVARIRKAQSEGMGTSEKEPVALAVCRSMGDRYFKIPDPLITCQPDIKTLKLEKGQHQFVVLMCDGVTDVMTHQAVCDLVAFHGPDAKKAAAGLVSQAYQSQSQDNLTAIVSFFNWEDHEFGIAKKTSSSTQEKVRVRHILYKHKDTRNPFDKVRNKPVTRTKQEAVARMEDALTLLSANIDNWDRVAKDISECVSVKADGGVGDLGSFARGKMQPEFEAVAFKLGKNELSRLVETDSGVHIMQRID